MSHFSYKEEKKQSSRYPFFALSIKPHVALGIKADTWNYTQNYREEQMQLLDKWFNASTVALTIQYSGNQLKHADVHTKW